MFVPPHLNWRMSRPPAKENRDRDLLLLIDRSNERRVRMRRPLATGKSHFLLGSHIETFIDAREPVAFRPSS